MSVADTYSGDHEQGPDLALAGRQVSGITMASRERWQVGGLCGIPSTSQRATTRRPRGRASRGVSRAVEDCPGAAVWSGYARSTGCHTTRV